MFLISNIVSISINLHMQLLGGSSFKSVKESEIKKFETDWWRPEVGRFFLERVRG